MTTRSARPGLLQFAIAGGYRPQLAGVRAQAASGSSNQTVVGLVSSTPQRLAAFSSRYRPYPPSTRAGSRPAGVNPSPASVTATWTTSGVTFAMTVIGASAGPLE